MSENLEKYTAVFVNFFEMPAEKVQTLTYQGIPTWDSVGHMGLMSAIEEAFGIMLEPDDIIDFSSFAKGQEILAGKHGVEL